MTTQPKTDTAKSAGPEKSPADPTDPVIVDDAGIAAEVEPVEPESTYLVHPDEEAAAKLRDPEAPASDPMGVAILGFDPETIGRTEFGTIMAPGISR